MDLRPPTMRDCLVAWQWRKTCRESLRTCYDISIPEQREFFWETVRPYHRDNEDAPVHIYWSIYRQQVFIGLTGITYIDWANSHAEISLIIDPVEQGKGYGKEAVDDVLKWARNGPCLNVIYGECFLCSPSVKFWQKISDSFTILPQRKLWDGKYWDSLYFTFFLEKLDGPVIHETGD